MLYCRDAEDDDRDTYKGSFSGLVSNDPVLHSVLFFFWVFRDLGNADGYLS